MPCAFYPPLGFACALALAAASAFASTMPVAGSQSADIAPSSSQVQLRQPTPPDTPAARAAYNLGWRMARDIREKGIRLAPATFVASFFAGLRGEPPLIPADELRFTQGLIHRQAREGATDFPARATLPETIRLTRIDALTGPGDTAAHVLAHVEATSFRALNFPLDPQGFASGVADGYLGDPPLLPAADFARATTGWHARIAFRQAEQNAAAAAAGQVFAKEFREKHPDAIALERGVLYRLHTRGDGALADGNDMVRVRYIARRVDGSVFEDSHALTAEPINIPVPALFPGLRQILLQVPVGSRLTAVLPGPEAAGLAWSAEQPGNTTLIYELEYVGLETYPGDTP